ncbi:MAG: adenylate kinase [Proteobacteria bacterium]|nr:adenylate kinase [Pseudomonadota bacterium]
MNCFILLGPPGAGKGTQAQLLSHQFSIPRLSTGDMLRAAISAKTAVGQRVESIMAVGRLVPDEVVMQLIEERTTAQDCKQGFVLDGFPRTIAQAAGLNEMLQNRGIDLNHDLVIINLEVVTDKLVERISGRFACKNCGQSYHKKFLAPRQLGICDRCGSTEFIHRQDDTEEVVRARLLEYEKQTMPLLNYYGEKIWHIDGMQSVEDVSGDIAKLCDARQKERK